jgi:hypothetical protein
VVGRSGGEGESKLWRRQQALDAKARAGSGSEGESKLRTRSEGGEADGSLEATATSGGVEG